MLLYVILAAACTAAAIHENDSKAGTTSKFSQTGDNLKDSNDGNGQRMEQMERKMAEFGEIIQSQGKIILEAKNEIKQLKATIQRQARDMKIMKNRLNMQEVILIEQGSKLDNNDKDIKELKQSAVKQNKEMIILRKEIVIMERALRKKDLKIKDLFHNIEDKKKGKISKPGQETELTSNSQTEYTFEEVDVPGNVLDNNLTYSERLMPLI